MTLLPSTSPPYRHNYLNLPWSLLCLCNSWDSTSALLLYLFVCCCFYFCSWLYSFLFCFCFLNLHSSHPFSPCYYLFNPLIKSLLYFLLLSFTSHTGLLLPCQCLCEFYANHCARIEALRRQLHRQEKGRQVEHTATAGMGWYCSWDVLSGYVTGGTAKVSFFVFELDTYQVTNQLLTLTTKKQNPERLFVC